LAFASWDWGWIIRHLSFIVFPFALLWRPLFGGEAFFWGTPLLQFVPWQRLAADMWRSGHLPLWNSLVGCGAPLAANYQTAAFYPLNALYLVAHAEVALSWTVTFHLALTGWGMYRWGRAIGLNRFPALVGALALQGSGFLVARVALFPSVALTFPWIPVWLWRAEVLMQRGHRHPKSGAAELRDALWLGFAIGLGLLAGHAQTAVYGGLLLAAYSIFRATQHLAGHGQAFRGQGAPASPSTAAGNGRKPRQTLHAWRHILRTSGLLLLSLSLGLGLAAIQLLPTAELLMHSQRSTGVHEDLGMTYSFWPWRLITILAPGFFGSPGQGNYWGYGAHWEDAAYLGLLPLLLAVGAAIRAFSRRPWGATALKRADLEEHEGRAVRRARHPTARTWASAVDRPLIGFWVLSAIVSLILALGKNAPVFPFLFHHVPGFDLFRAPARWLAVTTVALAALTAIGAQHWPRGHRARRRGALGATVGSALLIAGLVAPKLGEAQVVQAEIPTTFGPATARLGIALVLSGTLSLLRERGSHRRGRPAAWWRGTVIAFVALDLLTFGWPLVPTVDRSLYRGDTKAATILHSDRERVRVYWPSDPTHQDREYDAQHRVKFDYLTFDDFGPDDATYWRGMREDHLPNAGMLDKVPSANNFDPLLVGAYADLLAAAVETPRILETMGVTHVASHRPWHGGERIHTSDLAAFYRLPDAPGRAWIVPHARYVPADEVPAAMRDPSFDPSRHVLVDKRLGEGERRPHDNVSGASLTLQDGPNQVTIQTVLDAPSYLVLADTWYPGWQVTVDDEPAELLRANHAFRAVHLVHGEHTIEMVYRPNSVLIGGIVSLATGVLLLLGMIVNHRKKP
jgi:hypothetical protein